MSLPTLTPQQAADKIRNGAVLIDIRSNAEFAGKHINGARSVPLDQLSNNPLPVSSDDIVIFNCLSGMRTRQNAEILNAMPPPAAKSIYWKAASMLGNRPGFR